MRRSNFLLILVALSLAGCGGAGEVPNTTPPATVTANKTASTANAQPVLASSELVTGRERLVFGLIDPQNGQPITYVPKVTIQFFKVHDDNTATKVGDGEVIYRSKNLPAGLYVVRTTFDTAGKWGAILTIAPDGKQAYGAKLDFQVVERGSVPKAGDDAPRSQNETVKNADIAEIDSAMPHDDMHQITIADAVTSGKPTVLLFAAPGFCPSFTCGPDLEMVQMLETKYRQKANFIHIESPNTIQNHRHEGKVDPHHNEAQGHQGVAKPQIKTAADWGLKTEPWLFLIDGKGKVFERFEGGLTLDEVEPEFLKVLH